MKRRSEALHADLWLLRKRLAELGLTAVTGVEVHENTNVMVSVTGRGVLRLHRGYAYAPDRTLRDVITFVSPGVGRRAAREARKALLDFPVTRFQSAGRPRRRRVSPPRDSDIPDLRKLRRLHAEMNALHFESALSPVRIGISHRMKRKLGEIALDSQDRPEAITLSRRHIDRDGWDQVEVTLLHEMVHQWQAESGLPVDHGADFRARAVEVGIPPAATRHIAVRTKRR